MHLKKETRDEIRKIVKEKMDVPCKQIAMHIQKALKVSVGWATIRNLKREVYKRGKDEPEGNNKD